jgi:hypothetical protein
MGGRNATKTTARGRKAARDAGMATKAQLYRRAKARSIPGRSKMTKQQLDNALH